MSYTPGTRAFCIYDWDTQTRNSNLPCAIVFIPYFWSTLIELTDACTSSFFSEHNGVECFNRMIKVLLAKCTSNDFPPEIQRRIFALTNRAILKASKYLSIEKVKFDSLSISHKLSTIGISELSIIQLIDKINVANTSTLLSSKNFSSTFVVECVEILLSILSVIKESYNSLYSYLRGNYNYVLPVWIEAVIKLGQILNFMQGHSQLDGLLRKEIVDELQIGGQMENLILIQNISKEIDDSFIKKEIRQILTTSSAKVVDFQADVQIFSEKETKSVVLLIDGFIIENLSTEKEIKEEEPLVPQFWKCSYCKNENDKDNTFCIFCDKEKSAIAIEKPKKIETKTEVITSNFEKSKLLNFTLNEKMTKLKASLLNSSSLNSSLRILQGNELLSNLKSENLISNRINEYFYQRLCVYVKEADYIQEKLRTLTTKCKEVEKLKKFIKDPTREFNFIQLYEDLQLSEIDLWLDSSVITAELTELNINLMEKIRELVDLKICKEKQISLIFPAVNLRFVPPNFDSINHLSLATLENEFKDLRNVPLEVLRFFWAITKFFNNCLVAALPFIKPPDYYSKSDVPSLNESFSIIPFPKTTSAFLSSARGITLSVIKSNLIKDVIIATELNEDEVQIPTLKFERLNIFSTSNEKKGKFQFMDQNSPFIANEIYLNSLYYQQQQENENTLENEQSMFLNAYEQAKDLDPAYFRSKKIPGDPHVAFKVEFKGEHVQGIGGPYRQFFSDVSNELQQKDLSKQINIRLISPTKNNLDQKGEYKDRFTLTPGYNSSAALKYFDFLGVLMGICIRTGVHLTLDLCSLIWKKILGENINEDDIFQFDSGLYNLLTTLTSTDLNEAEFESSFNFTFAVELSDGTLQELIPDGNNTKVTFADRFKFIQLLVNARMSESDMQISALREGLYKIIPRSLLKQLERLICGVKTVNVELLKQNTQMLPDLTKDSNRVKWLWEILDEVSDDEKVKFIKFCWAQERLPSTQEEFERLQIHFTIKPYMDKNKIDIFPRADTCFFNLELPEYSTKEIMKNKILQAINLDNIGMNADKPTGSTNELNDIRQGYYRGNFYEDNYEDDI